ncbi:MAG TPA: class II aldolase/adducin family protein [Blastocatellia bacterium]|nr:class II aldolase/adducin family protein [Blastocatellia bacterium]
MQSVQTPSSVREQVSAEEWQARVDLAALYRLTALYKWDDLVFTHISLRVPGPEHHFLINPYGFLFEEITASSLVKVDLQGNIVMETPHFINPAGFTIHSAVHEARADALCVFHTHTLAGVAVSAQKNGLLPISQHSLFPLSSIGYHDYEGLALNEAEKPRLVADLGNNRALILRNHGLLTVGRNAAEAFLAMYTLEASCRIQVMAQSGGGELTMIAEPILKGIQAQAEQVTKGMGGNLVWPALLRKLDRVDPTYKE